MGNNDFSQIQHWIRNCTFLIFFISACGCDSASRDEPPITSNYQPILPTQVGTLSGEYTPNGNEIELIKSLGGNENITTVAQLVNDADRDPQGLLRHLTNEFVILSLHDITDNSSGNLTLSGLTGALGTQGRTYEYVEDYLKFTTWPAVVNHDKAVELNWVKPDFVGDFPVNLLVGVGVRIQAVYRYRTDAAHFNVAGLADLALNYNSIIGRLSVSTIGISGSAISPILPFTTDLSPTAIQQAVQACASIKAILYDGRKLSDSESVDGNRRVTIFPQYAGFTRSGLTLKISGPDSQTDASFLRHPPPSISTLNQDNTNQSSEPILQHQPPPIPH